MVDVHGYVFYPRDSSREAFKPQDDLHIYVGSAHCSSYFDGQSQSLNAWDEQR